MKLRASIASFGFFAALGAYVFSGSACSSKTSDSSFDGGAGGEGGSGNTGGFTDVEGGLGGEPGDDCGGSGDGTSLTGTVFDPGGKNPLYNAVVYIPTKDVEPFKDGVSCDTCTSLYTGAPAHSTLTDATGKFKFTNLKAGAAVKVVAQVGKFRRQITIPSLSSCSGNSIPDGQLRLPKNSSEGDLPNIAISTGGSDTLECLLSRMGIDASEFTGGAGGKGHIHIFQGNAAAGAAPAVFNPPSPSSSTDLWDTSAHLKPYDMVLLSCEGAETASSNPQALYDYANAGGRIFASHFHYSWFDQAPFSQGNLASWTPGVQVLNGGNTVLGDIVTKFPKGKAMHDWLGNVGALDASGKLPITYACANANVTTANRASTEWIQVPSGGGTATEYLSFNTPLGGNTEAQCGRAVFSDLHVGSAKHDDPTASVPTGCEASALSGQEKALEFMLFDLAGCVIPDTEVPPNPIQ